MQFIFLWQPYPRTHLQQFINAKGRWWYNTTELAVATEVDAERVVTTSSIQTAFELVFKLVLKEEHRQTIEDLNLDKSRSGGVSRCK